MWVCARRKRTGARFQVRLEIAEATLLKWLPGAALGDGDGRRRWGEIGFEADDAVGSGAEGADAGVGIDGGGDSYEFFAEVKFADGGDAELVAGFSAPGFGGAGGLS
jgi:hypothetical protein